MNQVRSVSLRKLGWRTLVAFLVSMLAMTVSSTGVASSAPGKPPSSGSDTNIEQSILFIDIKWSGFINYKSVNGYRWSDRVEGHTLCTGFFVSSTGHIATAGHCVDPAGADGGGKSRIIDVFLDGQVAEGLLTQAEADAIFPDAMVNWTVEGETQGSPPVREIAVIQPAKDAPVDEWLPVQLLDFRPFEGGDVALLKGEVDDSVPLPLATKDPEVGAEITSVGYPAAVTSVVDPENLEATFASGTVSGRQTIGGASRLQVDSAIIGGMSGGPTVDENNNVVGVNSSGVEVGQSVNFVTDSTDFNEYVKSNGIEPATPNVPQSESEPRQQSGQVERQSSESSDGMPVWVWFAIGAGVLLLLAVIGVPLLLKRTKRTDTPPVASYYQPTPVPAPVPMPPAPPAEPSREDIDRAAFEEWKRTQGR